MADKMRFVHQVAHLFRGQVLYAGAQFAILALLSWFGGESQSGLYILALATTAPIFMFFDLNLRVVRSTDQAHNEKFVSYVGLRACCLLLAAAVSLIVGSFFSHDKFVIIAVVTAFRIGDSLSNLAFGGFQRAERSDLVGKTLTVKGIISVVAVLAVGYISQGSAVATGLAMAAISIYFGAFRDIPAAWAINEPASPVSLGRIQEAMKDVGTSLRIAKRALPLGFDASISSLALNVPKYCVEAFFGTGALGVFGLLMQLAYSIQMLVGAVGHTGVSVLAKLRLENSRDQFWRLFNRMLGTSLAVGAVAVIGGTLVLPKVFGYFLGPSYDQPWLMALLLVASCLTGAQRTAGRATQACNRYFAYTLFDVVIFSVSLIASLLLVEHYKLYGAAISLVLAFATGLLITLGHTRFGLWPRDVAAPDSVDRVTSSTTKANKSLS